MKNYRFFYSLVVCLVFLLAFSSMAYSVTTIRMIPWGSYFPSEDMTVTPDNPYPQQAIKILAQEWEKLHPEYKIEFVRTVGQDIDYQRVMKAQLTGETAPEIIFWWPPAEELALKGWIVNMDPYLEKPNIYVPGNKRWKDLFVAGAMNPFFIFASNGHIYGIPVDIFGTSIWYNKEIFKSVGVTTPKTWDEFLNMQAKIQSAGYTPFFGSAMWSWWPRGVFGPMLYKQEEMLKALDVLNKNNKIDPEETARGWAKGIIKVTDPRFKEYLKLMKEWSKYWPKGFNLQPGAFNTRNMFLQGKLAMEWSDVWSYTAIKDNPLRKFDFGYFYFPPLTKKTTPLATGAVAGFVVHPGTTYSITTSAVKKGLVDVCIDWLMFITTPQNNERMTQEKTRTKLIPAIKGVKTVPDLRPFVIGLNKPPITFPVPWGPDSESDANFTKLFELYLLDKASLEDTVSQMEDWAKRGLDRSIKDNPTWHPEKW